MAGINEEWKNYIQFGKIKTTPVREPALLPAPLACSLPPPLEGELYISTKSKKIQLAKPIDLSSWAWVLPILPYWVHDIGIIKKQFIVSSKTQEELEINLDKISKLGSYRQICIPMINNEKNKYCDQRKIIVGLCNADLLKYNIHEKPFKNSIILNIRIPIPKKGAGAEADEEGWKDLPVKISNTGEIRFMGVKEQSVFDQLWSYLQSLLPEENPVVSCETILINANFYCGFPLYLEVLYQRLIHVYHASNCRYDPSNKDPGIRFKVFTIPNGFSFSAPDESVGFSISIFSTGSVLISGKCEEEVIMALYHFLSNLLKTEYTYIVNPFSFVRPKPPQEKNKFKIRKLKV
jgi:hypothetical protein